MRYKAIFLISLLFLVMAMSLMIIGCIDYDPAEDNDNVLKIGVLGPFSGPSEKIGREFKGAVEMAFEEIEYQIGEYKVEFVWIDSQSDPKRATLAYEEAAKKDNIDAGLLNWHSSVAVAAMDAAARNQVPHFFGLGATDIINEKYNHDSEYYSYWMGKAWPSPDKLTSAYIEALQGPIEEGLWEPRNMKVSIYGEDTDWGKSFGAAIASDFEAAGWEIVGEHYFPAGATELLTVINSLEDKDAAVIAGSVATASSFTAFIEEIRKSNLQSVIIADGLGWTGEWYEMAGDNSNYVLDQVQTWTSDEAKVFKTTFKGKYGFTPSTSSGGLAYDLASFFIEVAKGTLKEHGTLNRDTFYEFGQDRLWTGEISFTDGIIMNKYQYSLQTVPDPIVKDGYFMFPVIQYYKGEDHIIWPEIWKESDFKPPSYLN